MIRRTFLLSSFGAVAVVGRVRTPTPRPSPNDDDAVPFGDPLEIDSFTITVKDTDTTGDFEARDFLYVEMEIETFDDEISFTGPKHVWSIEWEAPPAVQYSISATAAAAVANDEFGGTYGANTTHDKTVAFQVGSPDPALALGSPKGLTLVYERKEQPERGTYRFKLDL